MIRQIVIIIFASYIICTVACDADKIGAILDKICAKRAAVVASTRIDKSEKPIAGNGDDTEDDVEDANVKKSDSPISNQNSSRKMYYDIGRRNIVDDDDSSEESSNANANTNLNLKRRRPLYARRFAYDEPNKDMRRRMMNGLRRKLSRY